VDTGARNCFESTRKKEKGRVARPFSQEAIRLDQALRVVTLGWTGFIAAGRWRWPRAQGKATVVSDAVWIAVFIQRRCLIMVMARPRLFCFDGIVFIPETVSPWAQARNFLERAEAQKIHGNPLNLNQTT
jgi:hypothetical protein